MKTAGFLFLVIAASAAGQDTAKDQNAKERLALKGKWEIVSAEFEGERAMDAYKPGTVIVIEGEELYFTDGFAKSEKTKFKIEASKKPKSIDVGGKKDGEEPMKGIYSLEMDVLKLCLRIKGDRPQEFKTKAGDSTSLLELKRQKP